MGEFWKYGVKNWKFERIRFGLKASVPCAAMGYCWRERFSLRVESFLR